MYVVIYVSQELEHKRELISRNYWDCFLYLHLLDSVQKFRSKISDTGSTHQFFELLIEGENAF